MIGQERAPRVDVGRLMRKAPKRDAILGLMNGHRTARQIAEALDISPKNVRTVAHNLGVTHLLYPASGVPIAARLPAELVLRDLSLTPEIAVWLIEQTQNGALLQDVIRAILNDAYQEEVGL